MKQTKQEKKMTAITVKDMIEALSKLPPGAKLVMTESGYYSYTEFAECMLPELYIAESKDEDLGIEEGGAVYRIGHSHQSY
jgi:hypothetical protein